MFWKIVVASRERVERENKASVEREGIKTLPPPSDHQQRPAHDFTRVFLVASADVSRAMLARSPKSSPGLSFEEGREKAVRGWLLSPFPFGVCTWQTTSVSVVVVMIIWNLCVYSWSRIILKISKLAFAICGQCQSCKDYLYVLTFWLDVFIFNPI